MGDVQNKPKQTLKEEPRMSSGHKGNGESCSWEAKLYSPIKPVKPGVLCQGQECAKLPVTSQ